MSNEQCPGSQSNREINKQRLVPRPDSRLPTPDSLFFIALCSLFTFHFLLFFVSCTTFSTVVGSAALSAETPGEVSPQWAVVPNAPGLDYFAGKVSRPRMEFHALRIDLGAPNLRMVASPGGRYRGGFLSVKVSSFVRDNGLLAGINALPFDPVSGREGEPRINIGIVIADGVTLSPPYKGFDALIFYKDGRAAIKAQSEINDHESETDSESDKIENAVGGFNRILEQGELVSRVLDLSASVGDKHPRHPRSAAGISANGKYLYLLVIDGRQLKSIGSTEAETAFLLRALGAAEGINFDGGGSSALAIRYPDGKVRVVNTPIHGQIPGRERAVAGCLGIGKSEK